MGKRGLSMSEASSELLHAGVHEEIAEIVRLAEERREGFPELLEEIRGYLKEDAVWREEIRRGCVKCMTPAVQKFLDSCAEAASPATHADRLLEFLQYDMNEFLPELLEMAEKGEQNAPAVEEELRGYLKEDPDWRTQLNRHFAKDAPARVKTFLDSLKK